MISRYFRLFIFFIFLSLLIPKLVAHDVKEEARWKTWANGGLASGGSQTGPTGLFRINRVTSSSFRDLRFSGYGIGKDSYFNLRYKSSSKYRKPFDRLYYFSTLLFQRNTRNNVAIRNHYNQGFGVFATNYGNGHINLELGHAFDMADYLNDTRKTSYVKSGFYWDHDLSKFSIKLETEYFYQISDVIENENLSRYEINFSLKMVLSRSLFVVGGYEIEHIQDNNTQSGTVLILLGWNHPLNWTF